MKRGAVLLFVIILLSSVTYAVTLEHDGWLYNNKFFDFDGVLYKTILSGDGTKLYLQSDEYIYIDLGKCIDKPYKKFCFNISTYDIDLTEYKGYVYIYYLKPEIKITRTIDKNILDASETASFTVSIENIGDHNAYNVTYIEDFPTNVEIISVRTASSVNGSVYWRGDLEFGKSKSFTYKIKSLGKIDTYLKASANYFDGINDITKFSGQIRLYSSPIIDFTMENDKDEYQIGEDIEFNLTIDNLGDRDIEIKKLNLIIPDNIVIEKKAQSFTQTSTGLLYDGDIPHNETKEYSFTFKPKESGLSFIILNGDYNYKNQVYSIQNIKKGFLISDEGIELTTSLENNNYINSNEVLRIYAKVQNLNSYSKIANLTLRTITDIAKFEDNYYSSLDTNDTIYVFNTEIKVPNEQVDKTYPINFNLTYYTQDGIKKSKTIEKKITVKPIKSLIIKPTFSASSIVELHPLTVNVKLTNPTNYLLKAISLKSTIPNNFDIKGATTAYTRLNDSQSIDIISFTLIPQIVQEETTYNISFMADYELKGSVYSIIETKQIKVTPKKPKITITKSVSESSSYMGELIDVSYVITNADDVTVYDLFLFTTQDKNFDTLNLYNYSIPKLDPGEIITISDEQIRPKIKGTLALEKSLLWYNDKYKRVFNQSSNSPTLTIKNDVIDGPVLLITMNSTSTIGINETLLLEIRLNNTGSQIIKIFNENIYIDNEEKMFKNITFTKIGEYQLDIVSYDYEILNTNARAYSNKISVKVINKSVNNKKELLSIDDTDVVQKDIQNITNQQIQEKETKKHGFFASIYFWFKNIFSKS